MQRVRCRLPLRVSNPIAFCVRQLLSQLCSRCPPDTFLGPLCCPCPAVWWHVIAGTTFVIMLPAIAPTHQSASWVFTTFAPDKAYSGIDNNGALFLLSLLGSQWAMGEWLRLVCWASFAPAL